MTSTLFILNEAPYGSERAYNGLRLAGALAGKEGQQVRAKKEKLVRLSSRNFFRCINRNLLRQGDRRVRDPDSPHSGLLAAVAASIDFFMSDEEIPGLTRLVSIPVNVAAKAARGEPIIPSLIYWRCLL